MWEIKGVSNSDVERLEEVLQMGYEPFAVTADAYGDTIWLRKKVSPNAGRRKQHITGEPLLFKFEEIRKTE